VLSRKTLCPGRRRHFKSGRAGRKFAPLFFSASRKSFQVASKSRINLETPLDEEVIVVCRAAPNPAAWRDPIHPTGQEFFQAVGKPQLHAGQW